MHIRDIEFMCKRWFRTKLLLLLILNG